MVIFLHSPDSLNPPLPWMGFPRSGEVSPPDLSFSGRDKSSTTRHQHPSWAHIKSFLMSFGRKHGKIRRIRRIFLAPGLPGLCSLVQGRILCLQSNKVGRSLFWRQGYGIASVRPEFYPSASGSTLWKKQQLEKWSGERLGCSTTAPTPGIAGDWRHSGSCQPAASFSAEISSLGPAEWAPCFQTGCRNLHIFLAVIFIRKRLHGKNICN